MASRWSSHVCRPAAYGAYCPNTLMRCRPSGAGDGSYPGLEVHLAVPDVGDAGLAVLEGPLRGVEALASPRSSSGTASVSPAAAVNVGNRESAALNFTTGLRICQASSRSR